MSSHTLLVALKPSGIVIEDHGRAGSSYLIICDGIGQLLDESRQGFGVISVTEEPNKRALFGKRLETHDNLLELPERGMSKFMPTRTSTNL